MRQQLLRVGPALLAGLSLYTCVIGYLSKLPCRAYSWAEPEDFFRLCYSDLPVLYERTGMTHGAFPYLDPDALLEYPVLQSVVATLTGMVAHGLWPAASTHVGQGIYFDVNVVLMCAVWVAIVLITSRWLRPLHAVLLALSPAAAVTLFINWDLWPTLALVLALWALRANRPWLAGVLIGVGAAFKLFPVFLLGPLLVLAVRRRRAGVFLRPAVTTALAWLACNVPFALADPQQWGYFWTFSEERGAGFSSVWLLLQGGLDLLGGERLDPGFMNLAALLAFGLCCVGVLVLGLVAREEPSLAQLTFLVLGAFVLLNKVYSPQYVLWLLPVYFLARPRVVEYIVWQVIEVAHWAAVFTWLGYLVSGQPGSDWADPLYSCAVLAHTIVLAYLLGRVSVDILRGEPAAGGSGGPTESRRDSTEAGADRRAPWETEPVPASARGVPA